MKRILVALVILAALCLPSHAADAQYVYKNATLGTVSTKVTFGFPAQAVLVRNRNAAGGVALYVDWVAGTADSNDDEIDAGAAASLTGTLNSNGGVQTFGAISIACASATCNVLVLAVK
jgi:hypothetical protein